MKINILHRFLLAVAISLTLAGCGSSSGGGARTAGGHGHCAERSHTTGGVCATTQVRAGR